MFKSIEDYAKRYPYFPILNEVVYPKVIGEDGKKKVVMMQEQFWGAS